MFDFNCIPEHLKSHFLLLCPYGVLGVLGPVSAAFRQERVHPGQADTKEQIKTDKPDIIFLYF